MASNSANNWSWSWNSLLPGAPMRRGGLSVWVAVLPLENRHEIALYRSASHPDESSVDWMALHGGLLFCMQVVGFDCAGIERLSVPQPNSCLLLGEPICSPALSQAKSSEKTAVFLWHTHTYRRTQTLNPPLRIGAPGNKLFHDHDQLLAELDAILYCVIPCTWRDHAGSFAVAIYVANVHLGLWTSSNSCFQLTCMEDHQPAVQVAVLCRWGWGSCKVHGWASSAKQ